MCIFLHLNKNELTTQNRLIYQEHPGENEPPAIDVTDPAKAAGEALKKLKQGMHPEPPSAKDHPYNPETAPGGQSIDPGTLDKTQQDWDKKLPNLKLLIDKLTKIEHKEFWGKALQALDAYEVNKRNYILGNMKRAILYKAIVENWDEQTLIDRFSTTMEDLYDELASRPPVPWVVGKAKRGWHYLSEPETLGMNEINSHLSNRKIQVTQRQKLYLKFTELENQLRAQIVDPKGKDNINFDQLEFTQEELLPFVRLFFIDRAIVEDMTESEITQKYEDKVREIYGYCVK